jgi:D-arginine dehydrogenase
MIEHYDVIIVGAGIAGASAAYFIGKRPPRRSVLILERESMPGMHSTGRSAALFMESYGPAQVRALTRASRPFLESPPAGFCETPLLRPRGALFVGRADQSDAVEQLHLRLRADGCRALRLDSAGAWELVEVLRSEAAEHALLDPGAADIDVDALHQGYLRGARGVGAQLLCNAPLQAVNFDGTAWEVEAGSQRYRAHIIINAAGAWVDEVARMAGVAPIGIEPCRRSAMVFDPPDGVDSSAWPCVIGIAEDFYFKPEAGLLLGSPANADPVAPHDVLPEEIDIAMAIDRIEAATTLRIRRPRRTWAGLRSFVASGEIVVRQDDANRRFIWAAALGGYGIQTSPAVGALCARSVDMVA